MRRTFANLVKRSSPAVRRKAAARSRELFAEILVRDLRKLSGMSQRQLARALRVKQPTVSRMERQSDMQIGTLKRIIEALGGTVTLTAALPEGTFRITLPPPNKRRAA